MEFIQPLLLVGAATIAAPIVLHLQFRPKPRVVDLGSIQFLQELLQQHVRRQRLRHWTLLAVRCLALMVLSVLFARPFLQQPRSGEPTERVVMLIDASASMARSSAGETLWRRALSAAEQRLRQLPVDQEAVVAIFDQKIHLLRGPGQADSPLAAGEILTRLNDLKSRGPGQGSTDYAAAMRWARSQCETKSGRRDYRVCLITDLQQVESNELDAWPQDVDVEIVNLLPDAGGPSRLTVRDASPVKHVLRREEPFRLQVELQCEEVANDTASPLRVELSSRGARKVVERELKPGDEHAQVELPGLGIGLWHGQVSVGATDGAGHFAVLVEPQYNVLLLDGGAASDSGESESRYLEAAIRLAPAGVEFDQGPFRLVTKKAADPDALSTIERQQIVVLADIIALPEASLKRLVKFARNGGGLLWFLDRVDLTARNRALDEIGLSEVRSREADGVPFQIAAWDAEHPIFAPFESSGQGTLERVQFARVVEAKTTAEWRALATFQGGQAAILERNLEKGRVLAIATGCGMRSGNWPRSAAYVPLVHQLLRHLVGRADPRPIRYATANFDQPAGVHESDGHWQVTNSATSECESGSWTPLAFRQALGIPLPSSRPVASASTIASQSSPDRLRPNEWWPWLAVALLCLLTLDTILANRVRF